MENINKNTPWICARAWSGIVLNPNNEIKPCCRYGGSWQLQPGEELSNSGDFKQIRSQMLSGIVPAGCQRCAEDEKVGGLSKRQRSYRLLPKNKTTTELEIENNIQNIRSVELFLSNHCNSRCVMCSPPRSSAWNKDALVAGYSPVQLRTVNIENFLPLIPQLRRLELIGGETFLSPDVEKVLQAVMARGRPEKTRVVIATNLTVLPNEKIKKILNNFHAVDLCVSIDSVGEKNNLIRYPSQWNKICENLEHYFQWRAINKKIEIKLSPTASAFSFLGLFELLEWWKSLLLSKSESFENSVFINILSHPETQSVQVLSNTVKARAMNQLELADPQIKKVLQPIVDYALNEDSSHLLPKLQNWCLTMDATRGTNTRNAIPEIFEN